MGTAVLDRRRPLMEDHEACEEKGHRANRVLYAILTIISSLLLLFLGRAWGESVMTDRVERLQREMASIAIEVHGVATGLEGLERRQDDLVRELSQLRTAVLARGAQPIQ
jgi:hypothetical protein